MKKYSLGNYWCIVMFSNLHEMTSLCEKSANSFLFPLIVIVIKAIVPLECHCNLKYVHRNCKVVHP